MTSLNQSIAEPLVRIRNVFIALQSVAVLLVVMHFFPESLSATIHERFDLNGEANIPTWFSAALLLAVSLTAWAIFVADQRDGDLRKFWIYFGIVYGYLSLDEAARLHELIDVATPVKWVYAYAPFALAFFLSCVRFLSRNANRQVRFWILGGLVTFALGGMLGELVSTWFHPLPDPLQQAEFVWEEGLEMYGSIMVLTGCLVTLHETWSLGRHSPAQR